MSETQIEEIVASTDVIAELTQFHPSLQTRINDIQSGLSPNGEHPNEVLDMAAVPSASLSPEEQQEAEKTFIGEYSWVLALSIYPYRNEAGYGGEAWMAAAVDGLFTAGETYDPETEPNFLKHLSEQVGGYLEEVFGPAPDKSLPSADEFEAFVRTLTTDAEQTDEFTEGYLLLEEEEGEIEDPDTEPEAVAEEPTPKRPKPSHSYSVPKQRIEGKKPDRKTKKSEPSGKPDAKTPDPNEALPIVNERDLPEPSLPHVRLTSEFRVGQRVLMLVGSELKDAQINAIETYSNPFIARLSRSVDTGLVEEMVEASKEEISAMLSEAWPEPIVNTMLTMPELRNFVPPAGFIRVKPTGEALGGIIIDSNRSEVIPLKAWERILSDETYQEEWLASGPIESLRLRPVFEHAIRHRRLSKPLPDMQVTNLDKSSGRSRPDRARPRSSRSGSRRSMTLD